MAKLDEHFVEDQHKGRIKSSDYHRLRVASFNHLSLPPRPLANRILSDDEAKENSNASTPCYKKHPTASTPISRPYYYRPEAKRLIPKKISGLSLLCLKNDILGASTKPPTQLRRYCQHVSMEMHAHQPSSLSTKNTKPSKLRSSLCSMPGRSIAYLKILRPPHSTSPDCALYTNERRTAIIRRGLFHGAAETTTKVKSKATTLS